MGFLVQYRLIEVSDAPTMGDIKLEQLSELLCCLRGRGVSPRTKRDKEISVLIECHVTVHHGAKADGANRPQRDTVILQNLLAQRPVTLLQTCPNIFEPIRPVAIFVPFFPIKAS